VLAKALYEHGQLLFAALRFIELAEEHPADSQAEKAIEMAAAIAAGLHRKEPGDAQARAALGAALNVLLERYPNLPTIDRWRYAAGRLALEEERFEDAAGLFERVAPNANEWLDAHFMQAAATKARAVKADSPGQQQKLSEETIAIIDRVRPIIEAGLKSAKADERTAALRYYVASLRVFRAQALINLNRLQAALDALTGIENDPTLDGSVLGEALKVRINAYQALKRPDDALREIQKFIETSPAQTGAVLGPMMTAMQRDVQELIDASRDEQAADLAQRTLLPVAQLLAQSLESGSASPSPSEQRILGESTAEGYRLSGRYAEALAWYDRLLPANSDAVELLLGKAECLFHVGGEQKLADAMNLYKRIAAAGPQAGKHNYWLAQLRMLQIIDQVNRRTEQILPRIEQLRQQDHDFGGERFHRGFDALRSKYTTH